jgi:hypothetical protein
MLAARKAMMGGAAKFKIVGVTTNVATGYVYSITCSQHANTKPGDLLFAYVVATAGNGSAGIAAASGWDDKTGARSGSLWGFRMFTRTAVLGTSSFSFPITDTTSGGQPMGVAIVTLRKAAHELVSGTGGTRTSTGSVNAPSVTSAGGGLLFCTHVQGAPGGGGSTEPTFPAAMTKLFSLPIGTVGRFGLYSQEVPAGATGTRSFGVTLTTSPGGAAVYDTLFKKA